MRIVEPACMRETMQPSGAAFGAQSKLSYSSPSAVCMSALRLKFNLIHFSSGTWLTTRRLVLVPTALSQPAVGALFRRNTMSCWSISTPRGSIRRMSELPTTAQEARRPSRLLPCCAHGKVERRACTSEDGRQRGRRLRLIGAECSSMHAVGRRKQVHTQYRGRDCFPPRSCFESCAFPPQSRRADCSR